MTAPRDAKTYLDDILHALGNIERYTTDMAFEHFSTDTKTQDAVVRNLEIIGEAVKRIPNDVRNAYPDIEWRPAAAMRDFLIHEYPEIDARAVWDTIKTDLPHFKLGIEHCLCEMSAK